jgi:predicted secreted Zn-dependent protease
MNSGDRDSLHTTFYGFYDTHEEAHKDMVETIERHKADWVEGLDVDEDCITTKIDEDTAHLVEGDTYDWVYYEKYFIFETDDWGKTFTY